MAPPPALQKQYMSSGSKDKKAPSEPRPSSSILLISPKNEILLLHRVRTSSSFASAHVFPGGNLEPKQDGDVPAPDDAARHQDGPTYRLGAIRECFEESGILLARSRKCTDRLLEVEQSEMERARKAIHSGELRFKDWVDGQGGIVDTDGLLPFTRWVTPTNIPKRFTTQMYIYFLPLSSNADVKKEAVIPMPTSDGGVEHTAAAFAPLKTWLGRAAKNEIILFPPQYYLMYLLAPFLGNAELSLEQQRQKVMDFLKGDGGDGKGIKWADKVMSPTGLFLRKADGRSVLALDKPGPELRDSGRGGDWDRVVLVKFSKEGPTKVEVRRRKEILDEERQESGSKL